jgi:hypothetical protein
LSEISDRIDLPARAYRKVPWENWNPQNYHEPEEPQFFNCYSVRPVRKGSLLVNQEFLRVFFSDITTYHCPPYDYTRANKDPSKRLVILAKSDYYIVKRRQAASFFYLKDRTAQKDPQWLKFKFYESNRKYRRNLQGKFKLENGRDGTNMLFLDYPITSYFKKDTATPRFLRFLDPKPVPVPNPVHPLSLHMDYPAIYKLFISKGITKIGD